jgi:uncharacterized protein DUF6941
VKVTLLLADSAQAAEGKLYVLGGGWSVIGPDPAPMALAVKIEVPWSETNVKHVVVLELLTSDGEPVTADGPAGPEPIKVQADFEVGRPPGLKPGTPIDVPLAVNFAPFALSPGQRYQWRLTIDGHQDEDWTVAFTTRNAR